MAGIRAVQTAAALAVLLLSVEALACPPPARKKGATCVLDGDVVLEQPMLLPSGTQLDCRGHALTPRATGTPLRTAAPTTAYVASAPEVALVLAGSSGVRIQSCVIGTEAAPFDFGVLVLDGGRNTLLGNTVSARYTGVTLVRSSQNLVAANQVTFGFAAHGRGIAVYRNSDRNVVTANRLTAHSIDARTQTPTVPQGPLGAINSRGINSATLAVAVLNFVYGDRLIQVPITDAMIREPVVGTWLGTCDAGGTRRCSGDPDQPCVDDKDCSLSIASMEDEWVSEDNVFALNDIDFDGNKVGWGILVDQVFGIVVVGARDAAILANAVADTNEGIHFGSAAHDNMTVAGTCTLDPSRWCGGDTANPSAECRIGGDRGACVGQRTFAVRPAAGGNPQNTANLGAEAILVSGNVLRDNDQGINVTRGSKDVVVYGNLVYGGNTGLAIRQNAVDSTVIERNRVQGSRFGVLFDHGAINIRSFARAQTFASTMVLNDFIDSGRAALSLGVCSNFALALSCRDVLDCDNSCTAGQCARTGEPCTAAVDCRGQGNADPVGTCVDAFEFEGTEVPGNHWGLSCAEGGFVSPDPSRMIDPTPYGRPVAGLPVRWLPRTCD